MGAKVQRYARRTAGAALLAIASCSSKATTPSSCERYASNANLSSPVSFTGNIVPIFQRSCASQGGTCHGDEGKSPRLGSAEGGIDAASVLASLVGVASAEDPTMVFVAPSDPAHSFLMHKMDGDQCTLATECAASRFSDDFPNCGSPMPFLQARLPDGARDEVRAWIAQGAVGD